MAADPVQQRIAEQKVDRSDIEAKLREIRGEVDQAAGSAKPVALAVAAAAVVAVAIGAYLLGRRGGKKRTTVIEVRRI